MSTPLVSIVIPLYNSEATVGAAISSALTQTYPSVEVVVVNDGSTDGGPTIAKGFGDSIRLIETENRGVSAARNTGMAAARGEFIATLDADDFLLPAHVDKAMAAWTDAGGGRRFVTVEGYVLSNEGIFPDRKVLPLGAVAPASQRLALIERNYVSIFAVFPRAMIEDVGGFDEARRHCEDYELWLRAVFGGWEVVFQTDPQAFYRRTQVSASRSVQKMTDALREIRAEILERHRASLSDEERRLLELIADLGPAEAYIGEGEEALGAGNGPKAAAAFATAARLSPHDRRLRLKAELLRIAPVRQVMASRQARRRVEVGEELGTAATTD